MTNGNMYHVDEGMPLRDYFAAHAMAYVATHLDHDPGAVEWCAQRCYAMADAMIAERDK